MSLWIQLGVFSRTVSAAAQFSDVILEAVKSIVTIGSLACIVKLRLPIFGEGDRATKARNYLIGHCALQVFKRAKAFGFLESYKSKAEVCADPDSLCEFQKNMLIFNLRRLSIEGCKRISRSWN